MESNGLGLLFTPFFLNFLSFLSLALLLLYTFALSFLPISLGLHKVPLKSNFLIEVNALSDDGVTMSVVLP